MSAFAADDKIDAVMAISPDALKLTSNGTVGTGAEGSVKGARMLLSTKTASRIIADVYAVRKDYFDANRRKCRSSSMLLRSQEALTELLANKPHSRRSIASLAKSADLLLGAPRRPRMSRVCWGTASSSSMPATWPFLPVWARPVRSPR